MNHIVNSAPRRIALNPLAETFVRRPSHDFINFWHFAQNPECNKLDPDYAGKWMIFVKADDLDSTWKKVYELTIQGKLGPRSSTCTSRPNRNAKSKDIKVVLAFITDYRDFNEVARIAWVLYEKGIFTGELLNFKTNEATRAGLYTATLGDTEVCRYSISKKSFQDNNSLEKLTKFFKENYQP